MGLDIYFHKTKRAFQGDKNSYSEDEIKNFLDAVDKDAQGELRKVVNAGLPKLKRLWGNAQRNEWGKGEYGLAYLHFVAKIEKILGKNYDHKIFPFVKEILPYDRLEELCNKEVDGFWAQYDGYFRKVNFIFHYFDVTLNKMFGQWFAFATAEDIDDLIYRCERVLKDHSKAHELLPTQSGFFFGSTDYDDWYFSDVKDCLKQMKKFRKGLTDDTTAYVIFSW